VSNLQAVCLRRATLNGLLLAHPAVGTRLLIAVIKAPRLTTPSDDARMKQTQQTIHL
jgi:hypothetical protein